MKRERARQIVVGLVGLLYVALIYPLYTDLLHSSWLLVQKNETEPMFLSFYIALGVFLLLAARKPSDYRSLILFAAWQSIAHASVMVIQTVEAWKNGIHRDFYGRRNCWCHWTCAAHVGASKKTISGYGRGVSADQVVHRLQLSKSSPP